MPLYQHELNTIHRINIIQGDHYVDNNPMTVLTTILGSCIATCLWDPVASVGGMNHFLLPGKNIDTHRFSQPNLQRYGINLMELLLNDLFRRGAVKSQLKAKIFGGAAIVKGLTDVGAMNSIFAEKFLSEEGIELVSKSVGGTYGRKIQFWPVGGRARQAFMTSDINSIIRDEVKHTPVIQHISGQVELF